MRKSVVAWTSVVALGCALMSRPAFAQAQTAPPPSPGWRFVQDGVVHVVYNNQGGPRGGDEGVVPNWWMGIATRPVGRHQLGLNAMLSLDAATVGRDGYGELFQVGESLDGRPLIDRQHPHDFFMQLAASWRSPIGDRAALTLAGGPAGEPTLGPVAFMHRPSAAGLFMAPLGHHTFDSTHVSFGVVTASFETGRWTFEASAFNGREPDDDRWDFDFGALDSFAARVWFRPTKEWEIQASTGLLRDPEELEPGDVQRTTVSGAWYRPNAEGFKAVTVGYGLNSAHGEKIMGLFGEFTVEQRANSLFGRVEIQDVETDLLLGDHAGPPAIQPISTVSAFTAGAARRFLTWKGFEGAIGAQVTGYAVPAELKQTYSDHPVSFQVFLRLRLPTLGMGRMWNMRMSQPHIMDMDHAHAGHVMR